VTKYVDTPKVTQSH